IDPALHHPLELIGRGRRLKQDARLVFREHASGRPQAGDDLGF
ncbi:MAG: hypothetical protein JWQ47_1729, partial [Glaciihabitans sp.]|nr:hypothetical protein [Glaciihabitans sp.]